MLIKALVAVRSGSERVKNKNIRNFAGSNLLELKLKQLNRVKCLDGVVVNSNSEEMLDIARKLGCEAVKRDDFYASSYVTMSEVYENMADNFNGDIVVYANCTNPLLKDESIERAVELFLNNENQFDSVNTAHLIKEFLFLNGKPVNYDLFHQPRSQDLPDYYALNFAINILRKETMKSNKNVVGTKPYIFKIDELESTDIDTQVDFDFAEFIYKRDENA